MAIASLKASPKFASGLLGLAKILRQGVDPQLVGRVLSNCGDARICTAAYTAGHLLDDIGELAKVKGIEDLLKTLKIRSTQAAGYRYELEVAVFFKRAGIEVVEVTKRITTAGKTDIDVLIREGNEFIAIQAKRSADAIRYGKEGLANAQAWVAKAMAELKTTDFSKIRYAVPPGVKIPPQVDKWFNLVGIKLDPIPHL